MRSARCVSVPLSVTVRVAVPGLLADTLKCKGSEETRVRQGRNIFVDVYEPGVVVPNIVGKKWATEGILAISP